MKNSGKGTSVPQRIMNLQGTAQSLTHETAALWTELVELHIVLEDVKQQAKVALVCAVIASCLSTTLGVFIWLS